MTADKYICKICKSPDITGIQVCDWLANGENIYTYDECARCGTLAIRNLKDIPGQEYYNSNYGSFSNNEVTGLTFRRVIRRLRNRYVLMHPNSMIASVLNYIKPLPFEFTALSKYSNSKSTILDVGCGSGKYLKELSAAGYINVSGVDPFLDNEDSVVPGIPIRRMRIEEISEQFDIIISHHSLEHTEDPLLMLGAIANNLAPNGHAIVTVPVLGKLYQNYKEYTYIIQAPQHTFLFTVYGLIHAAYIAGLELVEMRRGSEFESEWIRISHIWKSRASERRNEISAQIVSELVGPGDNVTFVFSRRPSKTTPIKQTT